MNNTRLIPVPRWNDYHDYPSVAGLRWLIFQSRSQLTPNGFEKCIRRIGRRVLIDEAAYFAWINEQNGISSAVGSV